MNKDCNCTIQSHPDYERVRKIWDGALRVCEKKCRELDKNLEAETARVVEYSNRISALLSEKADIHARLNGLVSPETTFVEAAMGATGCTEQVATAAAEEAMRVCFAAARGEKTDAHSRRAGGQGGA